jgi:hypothetical protein
MLKPCRPTTVDTTIHTARHSRSGLPRYPPRVYVVHHTCTTYRLKQLSSVRCVCRHAIRINDPHSSQPLAGLAVHLHTLTNSIAPHKLRVPPSVPRPMLLPARARGLPSPLLPRLHHLLLVKLARNSLYFGVILVILGDLDFFFLESLYFLIVSLRSIFPSDESFRRQQAQKYRRKQAQRVSFCFSSSLASFWFSFERISSRAFLEFPISHMSHKASTHMLTNVIMAIVDKKITKFQDRTASIKATCAHVRCYQAYLHGRAARLLLI